MLTDTPHWFMLSTAGDSIATVYGGYELFMEGFIPVEHFGQLPFELENPDTKLTSLAMAIYLVIGFISSIIIGNRRQLV
jgi:hypothetical protein